MSLLNDVLVDLDRRSANMADKAFHMAAEPLNSPGTVAPDSAAAAIPGVDYLRWAAWLLAGLACLAVVVGWVEQKEGEYQAAYVSPTAAKPASPAAQVADTSLAIGAAAFAPESHHAMTEESSRHDSDPVAPTETPTQPVAETQADHLPPGAARPALVQPPSPEGLGDPIEQLVRPTPSYIALRNVEPLTASPPRARRAAPVKSKADVADSPLAKARAQIESGELSSAESTLTRHLDRMPDDRIARELQVGLILRGGRHAEALRAIDDGLGRHPDNAKLLLIKARLLAEQGKVAAAVDLLRRLAAGERPSMDSLLLLGALYQQQGRYALAVDVYRRLLVVRPTAGPAWVGLAIGLDGLGKPEALAAYQRALRLGGLPEAAERYARQRTAEMESNNG